MNKLKLNIQMFSDPYVDFKDYPNTTTPIDSTNLNKIQTDARDEMNSKFNGESVAGNMVVESIRTKNMFDKNSVISGYLDNTGTIGTANAYRVSDYIPVIPGEQYTYQGTTIDISAGSKIGYYNASKTWVSYEDIVSGGSTITIPSEVYYLRTTVRATELDDYQFEKGSIATTYMAYQNLDAPQPTVLWSGSQIMSEGDEILLNDDYTKYKYIEIIWCPNQYNYLQSVKIDTSAGYNVILFGGYLSGGTPRYLQPLTVVASFSSNKFIVNRMAGVNINTSTYSIGSLNSTPRLFKIIGYK